MDKIVKLYDIIFGEYNVVVITGAGISTLSGLLDFRGDNGLYKKDENIEYFLSLDCFMNEQDKFYNFYKKNFMFDAIKPNIVHEVLAKLETRGFISTIITQNIDGLHTLAGSSNVIELHGNGNKFYCTCCGTLYDSNYYLNSNLCNECGSIIRPDIVLYGERVDKNKFLQAIRCAKEADKVLVLGSTLSVDDIDYVIANFIVNKVDFNKDDLFIINLGDTSWDKHGISVREDVGKVFKKINEFKK